MVVPMKLVLGVVLLLCIIGLAESILCDGEPKNTEVRLRRKLFCNYDKSIRPAANYRNKTMVKMKMIVKTFNFQDHDERLEINSWIVMSWKDEGLKWDPKEYDNIKIVYEPSTDIWIPDISLYNSDMGQNMQSCRTTECLIYPTGSVVCIPPCSHTGFCSADFKRWPYDTQNCTFNFGAWTGTGEEVDFDIKKTTIDSKSHQSNSEWKLISTKVTKKVGNYSCCLNETFPSLKYNFILERHSSTQYATLLTPLFVMILLNLGALLIQTHCIERFMLLGVNIFLHFSALKMTSWYVPHNGDDVVTIILMLRDSTIINVFLILFTIVLRWVSSMDYTPPAWVDRPIEVISSNKLGQVFMSTEVESKRLDIETTDDSANLVPNQVILKPAQAKSSWRIIAQCLDFLLLIILIVIYFIMLVALLPGYESNTGQDAIQEDNSTV